jgi:retrograde regulation protein 2
MYLHIHLNKDLKSAAALRSTTTGVLAGTHGASHDERAALAVMLCERWGGLGDLPPGEAGFYQRLLELLGAERAWWCVFFGRVAGVVDCVYPAGVVAEGACFKIWADWSDSDSLEIGEWKIAEKEKGEKKEEKKKKHKHKHSKSSSGDEKHKGKKHGHNPLTLRIVFDFGADAHEDLLTEVVMKVLRNVEKLGKRKNWPDEAWGCRVDLRVRGGDSKGN